MNPLIHSEFQAYLRLIEKYHANIRNYPSILLPLSGHFFGVDSTFRARDLINKKFLVGMRIEKEELQEHHDSLPSQTLFFFSFDEELEKLILQSTFYVEKSNLLLHDGTIREVNSIPFSRLYLSSRENVMDIKTHDVIERLNDDIIRRHLPSDYTHANAPLTDIVLDMLRFPRDYGISYGNHYYLPSDTRYYTKPFEPTHLPSLSF